MAKARQRTIHRNAPRALFGAFEIAHLPAYLTSPLPAARVCTVRWMGPEKLVSSDSGSNDGSDLVTAKPAREGSSGLTTSGWEEWA